MSKVFYDKLVAFEKIEKEISKISESKEEKEELSRIIDEYIHHRMIGCILEKLPKDHHEEFLTQFTEAPHHDGLWDYLRKKVSQDIEDFMQEEVYQIGRELLEVIRGKPKKSS